MKRTLAYLLMPLLVYAFFGPWVGESSAQSAAPEVFFARIEGQIDGRTAAYVERVISEAEDAGAQAVVLELDTPGGSLDSMEEIVQAEGDAEGIAIIAYVSPRWAQAASAGTFVVMGSDVAAMAPQTRLGAAHPVDALGRDILGTLGEKTTNDAAALITSLASAHGRNEEWAESAVRESEAADAEEALELGVVEYIEPDLGAVLEAVDGERVEPKGITLSTSGANIVEKPMTFAERTGTSPYVLYVAAALAALFIASVFLAYRRMRRWRVSTGREGMIGEVGVVKRPVVEGMGGLVFVHGERWRAVPAESEYDPIKAGTEVEVVDFRGGAVVVRALDRRGSGEIS
ncbi:MAG: hypothetical protein M3N18_08290 [Actinomycetota bacterium]|nr:hypothetical protein [Actinomycetota bacterium]